MKSKIWWTWLLINLLAINLTIAQPQNTDILKQQSAEHVDIIEALVLYPEDARYAMLEAALHPEALINISMMQRQSSRRFAAIIEEYPQAKQEQFFEISRYPELVSHLVEGGRKDKEEIKDFLFNYPEEIHETAIDFGRHEFTTLQDIYELRKKADGDFNSLVTSYPDVTEMALRRLIDLPEVLNMLTENISFTILAGDIYQKHPEWVKLKMDSLSLEVARKNAQAMEDWSTELENNPEAAEEFEKAAKEYADEYGYDEDVYRDPVPENDVRVIYSYHPYNYWFGYPYWYPSSWWYPYPYWYHWGFYFTHDHAMVVIGLPSFHFAHWYFYHPHHHYYYPHFSNYVYYHYRRHPRVHTGLNRAVNKWEQKTSKQFPVDWAKEDGKRVDRFREYGALSIKYDDKTVVKSKSKISKDDYLIKNAPKYPTISKDIKTRQTDPKEKKLLEKEKKYPNTKYYPDKKPFEIKQTKPEIKIVPDTKDKIYFNNKSYQDYKIYPEKKQPSRVKSYPKFKIPSKVNVSPKSVPNRSSGSKKIKINSSRKKK